MTSLNYNAFCTKQAGTMSIFLHYKTGKKSLDGKGKVNFGVLGKVREPPTKLGFITDTQSTG